MGWPAILTKVGFKSGIGVLFRSWITYAALAVGGVILGMWLYNRSLYNDIHDPNDGYLVQIEQVKIEKALCESQKVGLVASIEEQNESISDLEAQGQALQGRADRQQATIRQLQERNARVLAELDTDNIGETCEEAMQWMLDQAIEMRNED